MTAPTIIITCNECRHQSVFPKQYHSMGSRESFQTFCGNCGKVTLHAISSAGSPSTTPETSPHNRHSEDGAMGRLRPTTGNLRPTSEYHQEEEPQPTISDEELWRKLVDILKDNSVPLKDLFRCDNDSRLKLFSTLGFDRNEQQRLLELSQERDPAKLIPPEQKEEEEKEKAEREKEQQAQQQRSGQQSRRPSGQQFGLYGPEGNGAVVPPVSMRGKQPDNLSINRSRRLINKEPSIQGLLQQGDLLTARCSVYPDMPAEFWCVACNCFVSSRCHVTGIHKDHPFITLRMAAEAHVRDVAAWAERCRTQLNITDTVVGNLRHSQDVLDQAVYHQFSVIDKHVEQIYRDLIQWRDRIKQDIITQTEAEHRSIEQSLAQTAEMFELYMAQLQACEPLLHNMPPVEQNDQISDDWALRFMDFVTKLKVVNAEPIAMPKILIPEIRCTYTPSTAMELIKMVNNPIGVRLPDIIDPGYFHFPQPTMSTRLPFTLAMPPDGRQKGVVIENNRILTRAHDTAPSHTLVTGSQVFYSGTTSWEVHVDRVGHGIGRILAGVIIQGSDGEGVVWDGYRIVGPNEGESRTISDRYKLRPGTVLRFVLELDTPQSFLNCFFEKDGVARIPLPAASSGWVPAFSVFGPQDQITVVPTVGAGALEGLIPPNSSTHPALNDPNFATKAKIDQQELLIQALQFQLKTINEKLEAGVLPAGGEGAHHREGSSPHPQQQHTQQQQQQYQHHPQRPQQQQQPHWGGPGQGQGPQQPPQRIDMYNRGNVSRMGSNNQYPQQQQPQPVQRVPSDSNQYAARAAPSGNNNNGAAAAAVTSSGNASDTQQPDNGMNQSQHQHQQRPGDAASRVPSTQATTGQSAKAGRGAGTHYSPELAQLLQFVEGIK